MSTYLETAALDAEVNVLGSMLLDPGAATQLASMLKPKDFARHAHGEVFGVMLELLDRRTGIDITTLRESLARRGLLETVGGTKFIADSLASTPSAANAEHYARIVLDTSRRRALGLAAARMSDLARNPEERTADEVLAESRRMLDEIGTDEAPSKSMADVLQGVFDAMDGKHDRSNAVSSGFRGFDEDFGAFPPGSMVVVAARPSVGKTSLALEIATTAALDKKRVLMFSMEMDREQIVRNVLCQRSRIDSAYFRPGRMQLMPDTAYKALGEACGELTDAPLVIDDAPALDPHAVRARCLRHKSNGGLDLVLVDYLGLMSTDGYRSRNTTRNDEVGWISRSLKALAKELHVPMVVLSQLNRQSVGRPDRRPSLADLRDSGCVEQDADVVLLLHREEMVLTAPSEREAVKGQAELLVAKNRNGPTGMFPLHFEGSCFKFTEDTSRSVIR